MKYDRALRMRSPCVCFWQMTSKKRKGEWVKVQWELREEAHSYAGLHTWRASIGEYNVACNLIGRNSAKAVGRERDLKWPALNLTT